jgi:hypothetical protein
MFVPPPGTGARRALCALPRPRSGRAGRCGVSGTGRCHRCNTPVGRDEDGTRRCANGHTQYAESATRAVQFVENLRHLRALIEEDVLPELRSLREEVEALRAGSPEAETTETLVDLADMARQLKVSDDWLRRPARELGGRQSKKGGPWKFHPPVTMARFGASEREESRNAGAPAPPPRPLPSRVPLLPVKDRAA